MIRRTLALVATAVLLGLLALAVPSSTPGFASTASEPSGGTADFRDAPLLGVGVHRDVVLVGETVWYALDLPTGSQHIRIETSIDDDRFAAVVPRELGVFGPDLGKVGGAIDAPIDQVVSFRGRGPSATWFVSLGLGDRERLRGAEVPVTIEITGAIVPAPPGCPTDGCRLAERADELRAEVEEREAELASVSGDELVGGPSLDDAERFELFEARRDLRMRLGEMEATTPWPPAWSVATAGAAGLALGAVAVPLARRTKRHRNLIRPR